MCPVWAKDAPTMIPDILLILMPKCYLEQVYGTDLFHSIEIAMVSIVVINHINNLVDIYI